MPKKSKGFIPKNRYLDFSGDGRFSELRIKEKDKDFMKKQRRLFKKMNLEDEIKSIED